MPEATQLIRTLTDELHAIALQQPPRAGPSEPRQQRRSPRAPARFMVMVRAAERDVLVKARDLSASGLFLEGVASLPDRTSIRIPLPGDHEVRARVRTVRCERDGLAVAFEEIDWEDAQRVARYVTRR